MKVFSLVKDPVLLVAAAMLALFTAITIRIVSLAVTTPQGTEVQHLPPVEVERCQGYCLPGRPVRGQQEV
jgi:hypothetical protein